MKIRKLNIFFLTAYFLYLTLPHIKKQENGIVIELIKKTRKDPIYEQVKITNNTYFFINSFYSM